MIGKIIGAILGKQVADHSASISGPTGAILGAVSGTVLRRASLPALIGLAAGGYALKKYKDRRDRETAKRKSFETPPVQPSAA
ncbi:hypothetical protein GRI89_10235 [Altererythrobacter salegens]|uniref:Uncharacterized protein n=1 Tax=Croceibacterium salegens TaxID=1737568 RepID=A0A6I4SY15_9SPHN|nr:hypothetical protein [Croceibacterium salegens]MXO59917.1 hypothetical protein [Croceibacterium salegens]